MRRRGFVVVWHQKESPPGECNDCRHPKHVAGKCTNCNCGISERIWPMYGVPCSSDLNGTNGRRSRMVVNWTRYT